MNRVLITGGPGVGKTTLLAELAAQGHVTRGDSARAIIATRRAHGLAPRPEPAIFAQAILQRDIESYESAGSEEGWVFYERGVVDALGMAQESGVLPSSEVTTLLTRYSFHRVAFVLPPWESIYCQDSERDQSYAEVEVIHGKVVRWYARCGYEVHEVPKAAVSGRAKYVLQVIAASSASQEAPSK